MADAQFMVGQHAAQIETLSKDMALVRADVAWIRETLAEKRGERKAAVWFAATGGGVAATVLAAFAKRLLHVP